MDWQKVSHRHSTAGWQAGSDDPSPFLRFGDVNEVLVFESWSRLWDMRLGLPRCWCLRTGRRIQWL